MGTLFYADDHNLLKRETTSGSANMAAPTTLAYGLLYVTNLVVPHGQTSPPVFRYYYEPFKDGVIWPSLTDRIQGRAFNPLNSSQTGPGILAWVDSTNLYIQLFYTSNTLTGTFPVHWVIYKDFQL